MNNNRRFGEIFLGILLLLVGIASLESASAVALLIAVFGFAILARQFGTSQTSMRRDQSASTERSARRRSRVVDEEPSGSQQRIYDHALDAARSAGIDLTKASVYPVDIGVMAFSGDDVPVIYRTAAVPDDIDYVQPFIQLRVPMRVKGRIRFEILDSQGETIFVHETLKDLMRGDNLITPGARLPIHDAQDYEGAWELRITANDVPVAAHRLTWKETGSRLIRQHIQEDGEISGELKALVEDSRLGRLSLDDLLSAQDEPEDGIEVERNQKASRGAN